MIHMIINYPVYGLNCHEKSKFLKEQIKKLNLFHLKNCPEYSKVIETPYGRDVDDCSRLLPVRLFKQLRLKSVSDAKVHKTLYSSGTSGAPSIIYLDAETARLQGQVLVKTLQHWLGKGRRPMLMIDSIPTVNKDRGMTARAAGLQGFSLFGRNHTYALKEDMSLDLVAVKDFFSRYQHQPILIFGFTFMVWQLFIQQLVAEGIRFNNNDAVLIHGGGWKKLNALAVSNEMFRKRVQECLGDVCVHDYYGMVEQTGTIYMECEYGHFHCPVWSDIDIRDPVSLEVLPNNVPGLIQLSSMLARSYPGHCILTEDIGQIIGEDDCSCGRLGKYFKVLGRVPDAEVRGCSDTFS